MSVPLRYEITSWDQIGECQSNNSIKLHCKYSKFIKNGSLNGERLQILHDDLGVVFTYVLNPTGGCVTEYDGALPQLTKDELLTEFYKYGFYITYKEEEHLSESQLNYLETLQGLHYDKIRKLSVYDDKNGWTYIVVFQITPNSAYMNNGYRCPQHVFQKALRDGTVMNITTISETRNYDWSWMGDGIYNIQDILDANS